MAAAIRDRGDCIVRGFDRVCGIYVVHSDTAECLECHVLDHIALWLHECVGQEFCAGEQHTAIVLLHAGESLGGDLIEDYLQYWVAFSD